MHAREAIDGLYFDHDAILYDKIGPVHGGH
jgi:hypothetical protein